MPKSYISDAMRAAVGREIQRRVSYPIAETDIRKWALAVYYPAPPPPEFIDPAAAAASQWGGLVAPNEFNPFNWLAAEVHGRQVEDPIDTDRIEIMLGIEGPHLAFQLNGGMECEYGAPMRPGDVITSVSRLAEYREREGRLGLMLMSFTEDAWTNQRGEMVKRTVGTQIRY